MYKRIIRIFLLIALGISLAGCWNATRQYNKYMAMGQQRDVPLLIMNTSWNNGVSAIDRNSWGSLNVALLNTGGRRINSVKVYVTFCPYGSRQSLHQFEIPYSGPILAGKSYLGRYQPPLGQGWAAYARVHPNFIMRYGPAVIRAVKVSYADGAQSVYKKNVAQLLAPTITNYCRSDWNGTPPLTDYVGSP